MSCYVTLKLPKVKTEISINNGIMELKKKDVKIRIFYDVSELPTNHLLVSNYRWLIKTLPLAW